MMVGIGASRSTVPPQRVKAVVVMVAVTSIVNDCRQQIIGSKINDPELGSSNYKDIGAVHKDISKEKRKNNFFSNLYGIRPDHHERARIYAL